MLDIGYLKCISNTISAPVQIKLCAALLVEAAEMGNPDAQYGLGCRLRAENPYAQSEQQAFCYLEKAVDQLHPGALYLLGAVYLTGDCVSQDISSAIWCFHRASEKGHAASAIAYGSLLLAGVRLPESLTKFNVKKASSNRKLRNDSGADEYNPVDMARDQFEIAANAGCDLGLKWLKLLDEEERKKARRVLNVGLNTLDSATFNNDGLDSL